MELLGHVLLWGSAAGLIVAACALVFKVRFEERHYAECDICANKERSERLPAGWSVIKDEDGLLWGIACKSCSEKGNVDALLDYLNSADRLMEECNEKD